MRMDTNLDLNKNELRNPRMQNLSTSPSSPARGQFYYDTDDDTAYFWNGTTWVAMRDAGAATIYYQTLRDAGVDATQRGKANFVDSTGITFTLTDDSGNDETEISAAPVFGAVTTETSFGQASGNGAAGTIARSDHTHGTPAHDNAAHSTIPLSALAVPTGNVSFNSQRITSLAAAVSSTDATNLGQVQDLINVGTNKTSVRVATTANVNLATALENGDSLDGVTLATGDRVLVKNQTTASENGPYIVQASGAAVRATDADISAEVKGGLSVWVNEGTVNADTRWVLTTDDPIVLGTTNLTFVQDFKATSTTAGAGLTASGGVLAVGAGTGISVGADAVSIDTTIVARFVQATITGDGSTTSFGVTHNLGNDHPGVTVWDTLLATDEVILGPEIRSTNSNTTTFVFPIAPANGQTYRVTLVG